MADIPFELMMGRRFCPCCAMEGCGEYTRWDEAGLGGEICENDTPFTPWHRTWVGEGAYKFLNCDAECDEECCGGNCKYANRRELMYEAMEAEAAAGTFGREMWEPTFPSRSMAIVERIRGAAAAALEVHLPPVLAGVMLEYFGW
jgi:hypothetical protein